MCKEREGTMQSKKDSGAKLNPFSRRRPKLLRKLLWNLSAPNVKEEEWFQLRGASLSSWDRRKRVKEAPVGEISQLNFNKNYIDTNT